MDLHDILKQNGHDCKIAYGRESVSGVDPGDVIKIGDKFNIYTDALMTRLTDRAGFYSRRATEELIEKIKRYDPDIIQLHNLHGYYINIEILFEYLKKAKKPVVWLLHDCWSFTGHCAHFEYAGCDKWIKGCEKCSQSGFYPKSYVDSSQKNYELKKRLFTSIENMTIVTPSKWLAELVKQSFFAKYPVDVIYNGIDLEVFKPRQSDFRKKYGLENKKIILGVASIWTERKGLSDLIDLSKKLDESYKIVIVGKAKKVKIPTNMIYIERTKSQEELAEIYSAADVFINPTFEDNFPSVNIEALACGTPVITYRTGGSPEAVDEICGAVTDERTPESILNTIKMLEKKRLRSDDCVMRAASEYDKTRKYMEYVSLYEKIQVKQQ